MIHKFTGFFVKSCTAVRSKGEDQEIHLFFVHFESQISTRGMQSARHQRAARCILINVVTRNKKRRAL
jgi:hypothetical protein